MFIYIMMILCADAYGSCSTWLRNPCYLFLEKPMVDKFIIIFHGELVKRGENKTNIHQFCSYARKLRTQAMIMYTTKEVNIRIIRTMMEHGWKRLHGLSATLQAAQNATQSAWRKRLEEADWSHSAAILGLFVGWFLLVISHEKNIIFEKNVVLCCVFFPGDL